MTEKQEFSESELVVLRESKDRQGNPRSKLRIVIYNEKYTKLEKRTYYLDEKKELKAGKVRGFDWEDVSAIFENQAEIQKHFLASKLG